MEESILMGADFYEPIGSHSGIVLGIGRNCTIRRAILDKNVRIGDGVVIRLMVNRIIWMTIFLYS